MEWATSTVVNSYALNACEICKRRKRKCDKRLPQCSLCASFKNRTCQYTDCVDPPSSESSWNVSQIDDRPQKNIFPSVFFLDHEVFQQSLVDIPHPSIPLSRQISKLLGDDSQIWNVTSQFFDTIHSFMPLVSKKLFYERHLNPLAIRRTDVVLLCLCMKIFTWTPSENNSDPQTADYLSAKHYMVEVEVAGILTLQVLQANVLIAIYELGHGIYPSVYISIGVCATRGIALDLEDELTALTTSQLTWVEQEERRRVWWAILILERVVNLGSPSRTFLTKDPTSQNLLPVDDAAWNEGIVTQNHPINLLTTVDADLGRYGRLALATHLLCRVFQHKSGDFLNISVQVDELLQLSRTLHSAIILCDLEGKRRGFTCCSPVDVCQSALLMLHTASATSKSVFVYNKSEVYDLAMTRKVAKDIAARSRFFLDSGPAALKEVSPLLLHSPYKAAAVYLRLNRESPSEESLKALGTLKAALKVKNRKWRVAGVPSSTPIL